ncbi:hypothetical protein C9374_003931 [Naegleria lovaniensis]|uniref:EGF-like domain-containing protein n=1 Tax=Naegleria lovaniensis TaxID=51637 RepID=A0AA88H8W4_NAELO|nr:uncharacterized protein C9374_003931 [Naegleria lovaniensis]KAG2394167.1 hypothetical protein C9374_003931 [Naegleria lovaniensis]
MKESNAYMSSNNLPQCTDTYVDLRASEDGIAGIELISRAAEQHFTGSSHLYIHFKFQVNDPCKPQTLFFCPKFQINVQNNWLFYRYATTAGQIQEKSMSMKIHKNLVYEIIILKSFEGSGIWLIDSISRNVHCFSMLLASNSSLGLSTYGIGNFHSAPNFVLPFEGKIFSRSLITIPNTLNDHQGLFQSFFSSEYEICKFYPLIAGDSISTTTLLFQLITQQRNDHVEVDAHHQLNSVWTCYGLPFNHDHVCNSRGICIAKDTCICNENVSVPLDEQCNYRPSLSNGVESVFRQSVALNSPKVFCEKNMDCINGNYLFDLISPREWLFEDGNRDSDEYICDISSTLINPLCRHSWFVKELALNVGSWTSGFVLSNPIYFKDGHAGIRRLDGFIILKCYYCRIGTGLRFRGSFLFSAHAGSFAVINDRSITRKLVNDFTFRVFFHQKHSDYTNGRQTLFDFGSHPYWKVLLENHYFMIEYFPHNHPLVRVNTFFKILPDIMYQVVIVKSSQEGLKVFSNGDLVFEDPTLKEDWIQTETPYVDVIGKSHNNSNDYFTGELENFEIDDRPLAIIEVKDEFSRNDIVCYGIHHWNISNVCSGRGTCINNDDCSCNSGYMGNNCESRLACNGLLPTDPNVCSANGKCIAIDSCVCNADRTGKFCQYISDSNPITSTFKVVHHSFYFNGTKLMMKRSVRYPLLSSSPPYSTILIIEIDVLYIRESIKAKYFSDEDALISDLIKYSTFDDGMGIVIWIDLSMTNNNLKTPNLYVFQSPLLATPQRFIIPTTRSTPDVPFGGNISAIFYGGDNSFYTITLLTNTTIAIHCIDTNDLRAHWIENWRNDDISLQFIELGKILYDVGNTIRYVVPIINDTMPLLEKLAVISISPTNTTGIPYMNYTTITLPTIATHYDIFGNNMRLYLFVIINRHSEIYTMDFISERWIGPVAIFDDMFLSYEDDCIYSYEVNPLKLISLPTGKSLLFTDDSWMNHTVVDINLPIQLPKTVSSRLDDALNTTKKLVNSVAVETDAKEREKVQLRYHNIYVDGTQLKLVVGVYSFANESSSVLLDTALTRILIPRSIRDEYKTVNRVIQSLVRVTMDDLSGDYFVVVDPRISYDQLLNIYRVALNGDISRYRPHWGNGSEPLEIIHRVIAAKPDCVYLVSIHDEELVSQTSVSVGTDAFIRPSNVSLVIYRMNTSNSEIIEFVYFRPVNYSITLTDLLQATITQFGNFIYIDILSTGITEDVRYISTIYLNSDYELISHAFFNATKLNMAQSYQEKFIKLIRINGDESYLLFISNKGTEIFLIPTGQVEIDLEISFFYIAFYIDERHVFIGWIYRQRHSFILINHHDYLLVVRQNVTDRFVFDQRRIPSNTTQLFIQEHCDAFSNNNTEHLCSNGYSGFNCNTRVISTAQEITACSSLKKSSCTPFYKFELVNGTLLTLYIMSNGTSYVVEIPNFIIPPYMIYERNEHLLAKYVTVSVDGHGFLYVVLGAPISSKRTITIFQIAYMIGKIERIVEIKQITDIENIQIIHGYNGSTWFGVGTELSTDSLVICIVDTVTGYVIRRKIQLHVQLSLIDLERVTFRNDVQISANDNLLTIMVPLVRDILIVNVDKNILITHSLFRPENAFISNNTFVFPSVIDNTIIVLSFDDYFTTFIEISMNYSNPNSSIVKSKKEFFDFIVHTKQVFKVFFNYYFVVIITEHDSLTYDILNGDIQTFTAEDDRISFREFFSYEYDGKCSHNYFGEHCEYYNAHSNNSLISLPNFISDDDGFYLEIMTYYLNDLPYTMKTAENITLLTFNSSTENIVYKRRAILPPHIPQDLAFIFLKQLPNNLSNIVMVHMDPHYEISVVTLIPKDTKFTSNIQLFYTGGFSDLDSWFAIDVIDNVIYVLMIDSRTGITTIYGTWSSMLINSENIMHGTTISKEDSEEIRFVIPYFDEKTNMIRLTIIHFDSHYIEFIEYNVTMVPAKAPYIQMMTAMDGTMLLLMIDVSSTLIYQIEEHDHSIDVMLVHEFYSFTYSIDISIVQDIMNPYIWKVIDVGKDKMITINLSFNNSITLEKLNSTIISVLPKFNILSMTNTSTVVYLDTITESESYIYNITIPLKNYAAATRVNDTITITLKTIAIHFIKDHEIQFKISRELLFIIDDSSQQLRDIEVSYYYLSIDDIRIIVIDRKLLYSISVFLLYHNDSGSFEKRMDLIPIDKPFSSRMKIISCGDLYCFGIDIIELTLEIYRIHIVSGEVYSYISLPLSTNYSHDLIENPAVVKSMDNQSFVMLIPMIDVDTYKQSILQIVGGEYLEPKVEYLYLNTSNDIVFISKVFVVDYENSYLVTIGQNRTVFYRMKYNTNLRSYEVAIVETLEKFTVTQLDLTLIEFFKDNDMHVWYIINYKHNTMLIVNLIVNNETISLIQIPESAINISNWINENIKSNNSDSFAFKIYHVNNSTTNNSNMTSNSTYIITSNNTTSINNVTTPNNETILNNYTTNNNSNPTNNSINVSVSSNSTVIANTTINNNATLSQNNTINFTNNTNVNNSSDLNNLNSTNNSTNIDLSTNSTISPTTNSNITTFYICDMCSNRGLCGLNDSCICNENYYGNNCQISKCFGIFSNETDVCSGNGDCVDTNICDCRPGFSAQKCQIKVFTAEACSGEFIHALSLQAKNNQIYFVSLLWDGKCDKSIILEETPLLPTNILESVVLNYSSSEILDKFVSFFVTDNGTSIFYVDPIIMPPIDNDKLKFTLVQVIENRIKVRMFGCGILENVTNMGKIKLVQNENGNYFGIGVNKQNDTHIKIFSIDFDNDKCKIIANIPANTTDDLISKGTTVFNPETNITKFTFIEQSTDDETKTLSALTLNINNITTNHIPLPSNSSGYLSIIVSNNEDQYMITTSANGTHISSIIPNIDVKDVTFTVLATDPDFTVSENDVLKVEESKTQTSIINTNTQLSITIHKRFLTKVNPLTAVNKLIVNDAITVTQTTETPALSLKVETVSNTIVPITGTTFYLTGNLELIGKQSFFKLTYKNITIDILNIIKDEYGYRRVIVPDLTPTLDRISDIFKQGSIQIGGTLVLSDSSSSDILIPSNIVFTLYIFEIRTITPAKGCVGDTIFIKGTYFPYTNILARITLSHERDNPTTLIEVHAEFINTTFVKLVIPKIEKETDTFLDIRISVDDGKTFTPITLSSSFRYVDNNSTISHSLSSFNISTSLPDTVGTAIITQTSDGILFCPNINVTAICTTNISRPTVRQAITSDEIYHIERVISIDAKLSYVQELTSSNLFEAWLTNTNVSIVGSLGMVNSRKMIALNISTPDHSMGNLKYCLFSSNKKYIMKFVATTSKVTFSLLDVSQGITLCSISYLNVNIMDYNSEYTLSIAQSFSCSDLRATKTFVPPILQLSAVHETCGTECRLTGIRPTHRTGLDSIIIGTSVGGFILILLLVVVVIAVIVIIRKKYVKGKVGHYVYYNGSYEQNKATLQDLFNRINEMNQTDDSSSNNEIDNLKQFNSSSDLIAWTSLKNV